MNKLNFIKLIIRAKQSDIGKYLSLLLNPKDFTLVELITSMHIMLENPNNHWYDIMGGLK
jgi:hypothetical protein